MKIIKILNLSLLFIALQIGILSAQNVGINNPNPSEELDVNGNINLTGEVKIDGEGGQNGQFLQATGNGSMHWSGLEKYSNFRTFNSTTSWSVPSDVTEIMIEAWGGGGGGAQGGGGGAGGYLKAVRGVTPGSSVQITIGNGGFGSSGTGEADGGENTVVLIENSTATAFGGNGGRDLRPGNASVRPTASMTYNWIGFEGNGGFPMRFEYGQRSSTSFVEIVTGGDGGDAHGRPRSGGKGSQSIRGGAGTLYRWVASTRGAGPGAGGGGASDFGGNGSPGDSGQVIIYW